MMWIPYFKYAISLQDGLINHYQSLLIMEPIDLYTGCPRKSNPINFNKQSNNSIFFYCLNFFESKYLFIDLDFDTSTFQIQ